MKAPHVIAHGVEEQNIYCRKCKFSRHTATSNLAPARHHAMSTGHTVDVYRETRTEVTYHEGKKGNQWPGL